MGVAIGLSTGVLDTGVDEAGVLDADSRLDASAAICKLVGRGLALALERLTALTKLSIFFLSMATIGPHPLAKLWP